MKCSGTNVTLIGSGAESSTKVPHVYLPWVLLYSAVPMAARVFICHRYCCTRQFPWRRGCLSAMGTVVLGSSPGGEGVYLP